MDPAAIARFAVFLTALLLLTWAEHRLPAWPPPAGRGRIRGINLLLGVAGLLVTRLLVVLAGADWLRVWQIQHPGPLGAVAASAGALGGPVAWLLGLLALDAAMYMQHRIFHHYSWLWRWHGVHHSDAHLDATTALRFHPVELAISWAWKLSVAALLGVPASCLLLFEALLSSLALFNHSNLRLGDAWERRLAPWLITPAAHRRHHRDDAVEDAANYGFSVPWWDWLGKTWQPAIPLATQPVSVGIRDWIPGATAGIWRLLQGKSI